MEFISALNSAEPIGYIKRRDECFLIQNNEEQAIKKEQLKFLKQLVQLTLMLFGEDNVEEFLKNTCSREQFAKHLLFIESSMPLTISERRIITSFITDKQ